MKKETKDQIDGISSVLFVALIIAFFTSPFTELNFYLSFILIGSFLLTIFSVVAKLL